jgi:predicted DNA-binding protein (UPF0251 family)
VRRKLSDSTEDELFALSQLRARLGQKLLCATFGISRATLWIAIRRARKRRAAAIDHPQAAR